MRRKLTKIDEYAQILIERQSRQINPGEYEYVSTSAALIWAQLKKYYEQAGENPPAVKTIQNWFYSKPPGWAIAILSHALKS